MIWRILERDGERVYDGAFRAPGRPQGVAGQIVESLRRPAQVYICSPPAELRAFHTHGACWQLLYPGQDWFVLHWQKPAWDFITARSYVERMLAEALTAEA